MDEGKDAGEGESEQRHSVCDLDFPFFRGKVSARFTLHLKRHFNNGSVAQC